MAQGATTDEDVASRSDRGEQNMNETKRSTTSFGLKTRTPTAPHPLVKMKTISWKGWWYHDDSYEVEICILPGIRPTGRSDLRKRARSICSRFSSGEREMFA